MINTILLILMLLVTNVVLAEEKICPTAEKEPWDKMDEDAFSKEAAEKQLASLRKLFNGEIEVAEEFIHQSKLVIEGAFYRMEVDKWRDDPENYTYAKERFCKFMAEKAYLVH